MIELHKTTNIDLDAARKNYETVLRPTELLTLSDTSPSFNAGLLVQKKSFLK